MNKALRWGVALLLTTLVLFGGVALLRLCNASLLEAYDQWFWTFDDDTPVYLSNEDIGRAEILLMSMGLLAILALCSLLASIPCLIIGLHHRETSLKPALQSAEKNQGDLSSVRPRKSNGKKRAPRTPLQWGIGLWGLAIVCALLGGICFFFTGVFEPRDSGIGATLRVVIFALAFLLGAIGLPLLITGLLQKSAVHDVNEAALEAKDLVKEESSISQGPAQ